MAQTTNCLSSLGLGGGVPGCTFILFFFPPNLTFWSAGIMLEKLSCRSMGDVFFIFFIHPLFSFRSSSPAATLPQCGTLYLCSFPFPVFLSHVYLNWCSQETLSLRKAMIFGKLEAFCNGWFLRFNNCSLIWDFRVVSFTLIIQQGELIK